MTIQVTEDMNRHHTQYSIQQKLEHLGDNHISHTINNSKADVITVESKDINHQNVQKKQEHKKMQIIKHHRKKGANTVIETHIQMKNAGN